MLKIFVFYSLVLFNVSLLLVCLVLYLVFCLFVVVSIMHACTDPEVGTEGPDPPEKTQSYRVS